jgi:hypothetical protein
MLTVTALALMFCATGVALAAPQDMSQQMRQQRQQYKKRQKQKKQQAEEGKQKDLYPNATRKEPKLDLTDQKTADAINKGLNALNSGDTATAQQILQPFANGSKTKSKYAQALALQGMANIKYKQHDLSGAIARLKKALDLGVMPNNTYFQLMYELAQFQAANNQYQPALATLKKWRNEGKRETADSYGLEGIIDYRLNKYKDAIAAIQKAKSMTNQPKENWNQVLAASYAETGQGGQAIAMAKKQLKADPSDQATRHNLVVLLMQANKYPEALKEMEQARSNGQLTTSDSYINMAKLYLLTGQNSGKDPKPYADKALAVLKEGKDKGVVKPNYDYYKLKGDAAQIGGNHSAALAAYSKAAPMGHDGSAELSRAQLLMQSNKYSDARSAAKKAVSKGTKHKGEAYMMIAKAERGLGNKSAAVTAMKKAAQDPETRSAAQNWLKQAGH